MKEDYVSFETAKLLKEKGFDIPVRYEYHSVHNINQEPQFHRHLHNFNGEEYDKLHSKWYSAPTLQMAMKWLREKYNIHIEIRYQGNKEYSYKYYINNLKADKEDNKHKFFGTHYMQPINENKTYESACESAIKYCLTNLI